jgi:PIN domain nuclease of toxin-antitoxin system
VRPARVLLDTHAYLWFAFDDPRLSRKACKVIEDSTVEKFLSVASLWEMVIKISLSKLTLGMGFDQFCVDHVQGRDLEVLPIQISHLSSYARLPFHHRDPFDRLLIAQCQVERLAAVTADDRFAQYGVHVVW